MHSMQKLFTLIYINWFLVDHTHATSSEVCQLYSLGLLDMVKICFFLW